MTDKADSMSGCARHFNFEAQYICHVCILFAGPHRSCQQGQNSRPALRARAQLFPAAWRVLHPLPCGKKYGRGELSFCFVGCNIIFLQVGMKELVTELHSALRPAYSNAPTLKASSKNNSAVE